MEKCESCKGHGKLVIMHQPGYKVDNCYQCSGTGFVETQQEEPSYFPPEFLRET